MGRSGDSSVQCLPCFADAVAAVGDRHEDPLRRRGQPAEQVHGVEVGGLRPRWDRWLHSGAPTSAASGMITSALATSGFISALVPAIAAHDLEALVLAAVRQAVLLEHEIVHHRDLVARASRVGVRTDPM